MLDHFFYLMKVEIQLLHVAVICSDKSAWVRIQFLELDRIAGRLVILDSWLEERVVVECGVHYRDNCEQETSHQYHSICWLYTYYHTDTSRQEISSFHLHSNTFY